MGASILDLLLGKTSSGSPAKSTQTTVVKRAATAAEQAKAAAAKTLAAGTSLKTTPATPAKTTTPAKTPAPAKTPSTGGSGNLASATGNASSQTTKPVAQVVVAQTLVQPTITVAGTTFAVPVQYQTLVQSFPTVGSFAGIDYTVNAPAQLAPAVAVLAPIPVAAPIQPIESGGLVSGTTATAPKGASDPSRGDDSLYQQAVQAEVSRQVAADQWLGTTVASGQQSQPARGDDSLYQQAVQAEVSRQAAADQWLVAAITGTIQPTAADQWLAAQVAQGQAAPRVLTVPTIPEQAPYVPPEQIGPGGENPYTPVPASTDEVSPSLTGDSTLSQFLTPQRLLIFAAIGLLTGIWLIGN